MHAGTLPTVPAARQASLYAAVALASLVAGCGGSGYTKRDFITRADAICTTAVNQTRSIPSGTPLAGYVTHLVPVLEAEQSQLRALRRPPETAHDGAILGQYYAALARTVRDYRELALAARRGEAQQVSNLEADLGSIPLYSLASNYGLSACSTPSSTSV